MAVLLNNLPGPSPITLVRGSKFVLALPVTKVDGSVQDLTGATLSFHVRAHATDTTLVFVHDNGSNGGIVVNSPASAGIAMLTFLPADTAPLSENTPYAWSLWLTLPGADGPYPQADGPLTVTTIA